MSKLRVVLGLSLFLVLALAFLSQPTFAQVETGEIEGAVTDATGAAVPGATITVTDTDTGTARVVKTDDQGRYTAVDLSVGHYQVQAEMKGFSTLTQTGFVLTVGQSLVVDLKLQLGAVAQAVEVSASS